MACALFILLNKWNSSAFPLFCFEPPLGMFLPEHIPQTQLIAFARCLGFVGWDVDVLRDHLNPTSLSELVKDCYTYQAQIKAAKYNVAMGDVIDQSRLVYNIPSCMFFHTCMFLYHTCRVWAPGAPRQASLKFKSVGPGCQSN